MTACCLLHDVRIFWYFRLEQEEDRPFFFQDDVVRSIRTLLSLNIPSRAWC